MGGVSSQTDSAASPVIHGHKIACIAGRSREQNGETFLKSQPMECLKESPVDSLLVHYDGVQSVGGERDGLHSGCVGFKASAESAQLVASHFAALQSVPMKYSRRALLAATCE